MYRRRYQRVPFFCEVTLMALPQGKPVPSRTIDISLGGVGVVTAARVEPGQQVAVAFSMRNGRQEATVERVLGKVVNLRADENANVVGVEFVQPLDAKNAPLLLRKVMSV